MGRDEDLKDLDMLHQRRNKAINKYGFKKRRAKLLGPTLAMISWSAIALHKKDLINAERIAAIKPEVDKYAAEEAHKIDIMYDNQLDVEHHFSTIDSTNVCNYLFEHYIEILDNGAGSDIRQKYANDYFNHAFDYVYQTMQEMFDSVQCSIFDAFKEAIPSTLGCTAVIGLYYAQTLLRSKREIDKINNDVYKLEDKLFWDR
ncbi:MAG: hypothetical protein IKQ31_03770 [Clostridia bacterium]|nr:hypothetical protein [Clostridia bacterium]